MRFVAVLNRDGGTLRTIDLEALRERMAATLEAAGHTTKVVVVSGQKVEQALADAAGGDADVVLAGGGDGTISTAAARLMNTDKALAVLPAGTMNLFARSLGIPLAIDEAIEAFAKGRIRAVDVASASGRVFIHQFSVGMHAKMVDMRENMQFASRLGKMRASVRAAFATILDPPSLNVSVTVGETEILTRTTGIGVTNNLFGEGHLPYADKPDGGVLGIYVTVARERSQIVRFFLNMARGRWRDNPHVEIHEGDRALLKLLPPIRSRKCVIDGELAKLERETSFEIHRKVLKVLVPNDAAQP